MKENSFVTIKENGCEDFELFCVGLNMANHYDVVIMDAMVFQSSASRLSTELFVQAKI